MKKDELTGIEKYIVIKRDNFNAVVREGPLSLISDLLYVRAAGVLDEEILSGKLIEISRRLSIGFKRSLIDFLSPSICFLSYALSKKINIKDTDKNNYISETISYLLKSPSFDEPETAGIYFGIVRSSALYAVYRMSEDIQKEAKIVNTAAKTLSFILSAVPFVPSAVPSAVDLVVGSGTNYYVNRNAVKELDAFFNNKILDFINPQYVVNPQLAAPSLPVSINSSRAGLGANRVDRFNKWYNATTNLISIDSINSCKKTWNEQPISKYIDDLPSEWCEGLISICGSSN